MLEVKDKDISAIKCSNTIFFNNNLDLIKSQLEKYKYCIKEKNHLYKLLSTTDSIKIKEKIHWLSTKYNIKELINSYYFYY